MKSGKLIGTALIVTLALAGLFLLARRGGLTAETVTRQMAVQNMLSPAGANSTAGALNSETRFSAVVEPVSSLPVRDLPQVVELPQADWYQLWLNGELDTEFEGVPPALLPSLLGEAMNLPASLRNPAQGPGPNLLDGWKSIDSTDCCGGGGGLTPPDPEMAAGPNHVIAVVNVAFEIYDKTGNSLVGPTTFSSFFGPLGGPCVDFPFDPNVLYDEQTDRFIIAADGDGFDYCVGVSQTADPTGAYHLYAFPADIGGAFFDYPHAGVGQDAIYMGGNLFGGGQGYVYAFDKHAMYAGGPAPMEARILSGGFHTTPQPARLHGWAQGTWPTTGPHYFIAGTGFGNASTYQLYSWDDPFGADVLTWEETFNFPAIHGMTVGNPVNAQQQGGSGITGNDPRPLDFDYRNGTAWTVMTVSCNPGGGTVNCIQWAQIDLENGTVLQTDVFATDAQYRYFPDIAADDCGNTMVGYTRSSSTTWPGVFIAGPLQAGSNPPEEMAKDGEVAHYSYANRWGDYSGMTIDPDGTTFWYLGEYSIINGHPNVNWGNWIQSADLGCSAVFNMSGSMAQEALPGEDVTYTLTLTNTSGVADTYDITVSGETWSTVPSVASVSLDPGDSGSFDVVVSIPAGVPGGSTDVASVTATSTVEPLASKTANLTTTATAVYGLTLEQDVSGAGDAGDVVSYTLTIENTGNTTDTIDLAVSGESWTTTLSENSVVLAAGESADVVVEVTIPGGANGGDSDSATVTATSAGDPGVSDSVTVTTTVGAIYALTLAEDMNGTGGAGEVVSYTLTITNEGNTTDTIDLVVSGETWTTTPSENSVVLAPGESAEVVVEVTIPGDAADGDSDSATVTATSAGDPGVSASVTLTTEAEVEGGPAEYSTFLPIMLAGE